MTNEREQEVLSEKPAQPQRHVVRKKDRAREVGGPKGPEPTRYGDWERSGRCIDF